MSYSNAPHNIGDAAYCSDTCAAAKLPEPTMRDIMQEVSLLAEQNHLMVHRIRSFLTGETESLNERAKEPGCFKEELLKARYEVHCTNEELGRLAEALGLQ